MAKAIASLTNKSQGEKSSTILSDHTAKFKSAHDVSEIHNRNQDRKLLGKNNSGYSLAGLVPNELK